MKTGFWALRTSTKNINNISDIVWINRKLMSFFHNEAKILADDNENENWEIEKTF